MKTQQTAQYTPGPWEFSPGRSPHFQSQIWREDGKTLAVTYGDEDNANARLMAASPDLLEALEEILDLPVDDSGERIIPAGFLDKTRAAITKATQP